MLPAMGRRGNGASQGVTVLTAALLSVAVGAGTIAGCSSEEEPAPQAQEQKKDKLEPEPEPEPTPDEPELPEDLDEPYVHVVLDYYDAWHKALDTGDTDSFMKYATKQCLSCEGMKDQIDETVAKGGSSELSSLDPILGSKRNMAQSHGDNEASVLLHYRYGKFTRVEKAGVDAKSWPAEETVEQVSLIREGGQWLIDKITPLQLDGQ